MEVTTHNLASTIMRAGATKFEPLIHSLVEKKAVGMIVAPAKAKKSMLALNLVYALITKKPFLGFEVSPEPERIVYVNLELTRTALNVRLRTMNKHYEATGKQLDDLCFFTAEEFTNNSPLVDVKNSTLNEEPFKSLTEAAKKWRATVIIIDPLYYVVGEENDNVLMTAVIREFGKLRDAVGATIFIVHHTGKASSDWSDPFLMGRGASSLAGGFEFVLGIEPRANGKAEARLHHGSRNLKSIDPFTIQFDETTLTWQSLADAKSADSILDGLMGKNDELLMDELVIQSQLSKKRIDELIRCSKTYVKSKAHRGQRMKLMRKV